MRIFFSVGEPSGDQHAAHLIRSLKDRNSGIELEGFGGPEMREEGCELLFELTQMAVMGFLRVLPMLAKFRDLVRQAERHFDHSAPDAVVLVDFPGFNWWIARAAKKRGIPVYYYLPPQLWAWAPWRIRKVRKYVDHVICTLPFEYDWYKARGVSATWVSHPFFDEVAAKKLDPTVMGHLSEKRNNRMVAILPGSRNGEVRRNFPSMLQIIDKVAAVHPEIRWVVGSYCDQQRDMCQELQAQSGIRTELEYLVGRTSEVIESADCCLMVSGSVSLELLARHTPGIVLYRVARYEKLGARFLMNCRFITLTNLIADEEIMPEFISAGDPKPEIDRISEWLIEVCSSPERLAECRRQMVQLADRAALIGATDRTADLILSELNVRSQKRQAA